METHGAAIFQGPSCASPASRGGRLFHRSRLRLVLALGRKGVTLCKAGVWVGIFFPSSITFSLSFIKQVSMGHLSPPVPSPSDLLDWLTQASPSLGSCWKFEFPVEIPRAREDKHPISFPDVWTLGQKAR